MVAVNYSWYSCYYLGTYEAMQVPDFLPAWCALLLVQLLAYVPSLLLPHPPAAGICGDAVVPGGGTQFSLRSEQNSPVSRQLALHRERERTALVVLAGEGERR